MWPGLYVRIVSKNLPTHVIATVKGHLKQERQYPPSTKKPSPTQTIKKAHKEEELYYFPPSDTPNVKKNGVICSMLMNFDKTMGYMYLTGRCPHCSASGHKYLLIGYNYNANDILVGPIKNRQTKTIANGWEKINQQFATLGFQPHTYILDNEVSNTPKKALNKYTVNYQLVPPHSHLANKSEHAIKTLKDNFKGGLATLYSDFPIAHWDLLLTKPTMNLNILKASRLNPKYQRIPTFLATTT